MTRLAIACNLLLFLLTLYSTAQQPSSPLSLTDVNVAAAEQAPTRIESQHLPNAITVHPSVISGGLPEDDAAFKELADRGIKTIISVDGLTPDVNLAAKHGLRYVHLPHGYDGIPADRAMELAKAVRDLPSPIYIHCHHGKHRSPTAASVACVTAGLLPSKSAIDILKLAGTSPIYRGLYQSACDAVPMSREQIDSLRVTFRSVQEVPPLAKAMVDLEHTFASVQKIADANWQSPKDHPDLDPAHESRLLAEHFAEMLRSDLTQSKPNDFHRMLKESETVAMSLANLLEQRDNAASHKTATRYLRRIKDDCKACHVQFRNKIDTSR